MFPPNIQKRQPPNNALQPDRCAPDRADFGRRLVERRWRRLKACRWAGRGLRVVVPIPSAARASCSAGVGGCRPAWRARGTAVPASAGAGVGARARRRGRRAPAGRGAPVGSDPARRARRWCATSRQRVPAFLGAGGGGCRPSWRADRAAVPAVARAGAGGCRRGRSARGGGGPSARGRGAPVVAARPRPTPRWRRRAESGRFWEPCGAPPALNAGRWTETSKSIPLDKPLIMHSPPLIMYTYSGSTFLYRADICSRHKWKRCNYDTC